MATCKTCAKPLDKAYKTYCDKVCNPSTCDACASPKRPNGSCIKVCLDCNKHSSNLYFDRCVDCRLKQKKQRTLNNAAKKPSQTPGYTQSILGLEREIVALQKENAKLKDRMSDMEDQMALIVDSVSEICTRNLQEMEQQLDG